MLEPRLHHVLSLSLTPGVGFHKIAYWEWPCQDFSLANPPTIICAHGLTRNGRDFDVVAQALMPFARVIAPDFLGRGQSTWTGSPASYHFPQYLQDMTALIAALHDNSTHQAPRAVKPGVHWLGTSMGGIAGMLLAAMPGSPLRSLLLNDVGPVLGKAGLQRIMAYVGTPVQFSSFEQAREAVINNSATFGPHSDAEWTYFVRHYVKEAADGKWIFNFDPAISIAFKQSSEPIDLWAYYDAIRCPTMIFRGSESDLFERATAQAMTQRGPRAALLEFESVGHAPTLIPAHQVEAVKQFFLSTTSVQ